MDRKISKSLILIIVVSVFSLVFATKALSQTSTLHFTFGNGDSGSKCETNPTDCLKNDFNITVRGNVTQEKLSDVYDRLAEVAIAVRYKNLLRSAGPTVIILANDSKSYCHGQFHWDGNNLRELTLYNFDSAHCTKTRRRDHILHESGHVIKSGHKDLFLLYVDRAYYPHDASCYHPDSHFTPKYFINTYDTSYAAEYGLDISGSNESMADSMALYLNPILQLSHFPTQCPIGYKWIGENIFDNYIFK